MILFEGSVEISYAQAYVLPSGGQLPAAMERIQQNGLCWPDGGGLHLMVGTEFGSVRMTVEVLDGPPVRDLWEDEVEVSYHVVDPRLALVGDSVGYPILLPTAGWYRVRYAGQGMDEAAEALNAEDPSLGEPADRYALNFWLAPPREDDVIRQTSNYAAYWHDIARHGTKERTSRPHDY